MVKIALRISLAAAILGCALLAAYRYSARPLQVGARRPPPSATTALLASETVPVTVYLPRADLASISPFEAQLPDGRSSLPSWISALVGALSVSPGPDTVPLFPPGTRARSAFLAENGTIYLDLPSEALQSSGAGIQLEMLAVEALVKSIVPNVERARRLKILADGTDRETFWGHVYVRLPIEIQ
jgi:hypothetical protein